MAVVIAFSAAKGGVGKTTLAVNIAAVFATENSTLLIDLDGQGNASHSLLGPDVVDGLTAIQTSAAILGGMQPLPEDVIHQTRFENLSVVPANRPFENWSDQPARDLQMFLQEASQDVDVVIVDSAPNLSSPETKAALASVGHVVIPVVLDPYSARSIGNTLAAAEATGVEVLGLALNMTDTTVVSREYRSAVESVYKRQLFKTDIPRMQDIRTAAMHRMPLQEFKPKCKGAEKLKALSVEIAKRIHRKQSQTRKAA